MTLAPGTRLGVYQVLAPIGQGGMGEVYRARDTQLKRDVALKVLSARLETHPERLARFQREAEILASLNHPNVAAIYGLSEGALVMELVPGATLLDRLRNGAIPIDEALDIARQVVAAIEYAHDQGIVHRDLKPSNIKITPDGQVKVLDFGLAKALDERTSADAADRRTSTPDGSTSSVPPLSADDSPTITLANTQAGVVFGTVGYMSPEQAAGKAVDRRSDIFSFGVILFEMLSGRRAFPGESVPEVLAAVVRHPPDWSALPAGTPPYVRHLLERCLRKEKLLRLQSIGEARIALDDPGLLLPDLPKVPPLRLLPFVIAAAAILIAVALAVWIAYSRRPALQPPLYATLLPPAESNYAFQGASLPVLSPDGRQILFRAASRESGTEKILLFTRALDSPTAQPLPGTEGASGAIWSPDSRSIAFVVENQLKRLDIDPGGANSPVLPLADLPAPFRGGTWSSQGVLLLGLNNQPSLLRVPATGGRAEPAGRTEGDEVSLRFPQFLPDGDHYLYQATLGSPNGDSQLRVGSLSASRNPGKLVTTIGSNTSYAAGYLFFLREGTLAAQPFDESNFQLTGPPIALADSVATYSSPSRAAAFSVAANGTLIYQPGPPGQRRQLAWYNRRGERLSTLGEPANDLADIQLAADGKLAVVSFRQGSNTDLWAIDTANGIRTRLTSDPAADNFPVLSSDGASLFWHGRNAETILTRAIAGGEPRSLLTLPKSLPSPAAVSPDGKWLLYFARLPGRDVDIFRLPIDGVGEPLAYLAGHGDQWLPTFSPDGAWVAFVSDESGRNEVYVARFPDGGSRRQVSPQGGTSPRWSPNGREILFGAPDSSLNATALTLRNGALEPGRTQRLFADPRFAYFDIARDGRFLIVESLSGDETAQSPLSLIQNWFSLVRR